MTLIVPTNRDDAAIHLDPKTVAKRNVKQVEPYPEVQPVKEHNEGHSPVPPVRREKKQRREGDRRRRDEPILLDTRDGHGRRKVDHPAEEDEAVVATHIDVFT